ncbi:D-aminoacyl-tRNA deacylase [Olsenella urininfantis]|uniref:D-aminoacyl-tRNA deacylase n=1 Tax=Olsenella urininfantis TaxID=1871033 RepID=UPI000986F4A9|nr:D-aminoacyl-tRNA deacylase [Olsenella urininfantis]
MRAVIQRVRQAKVEVEGREVGSCGRGYLVLLGVAPGDGPAEAQLLWDKISHLRIFDDEQGKVNLSLGDVGGELLVVSQFTLFADCRRGRRPSFTSAAAPELASSLYEQFCLLAEGDSFHVGRGVFGADMQVSLVNDGPFTVCLDTVELTRPRRQER